MAVITFENIIKNFGSVKVIRDLSLTVEEGEFFTFVGPSGCGKSTILNMLAGLEEITTGSIFFDDQPVGHLTPKDRDVAMVFQSYALYPHLTVHENLAFPLKMKRTDVDTLSREVRRVAALLGLESLLARKPRELSGGQRQRVALGRAIIRKPKVFLMDEPLSNLDARLRVEMRVELKKLHRDLKITTIYVTHDQAEAMSLSDRIAVLHDGIIQQCGRPQEIYQRPASMMVASFIGSPAMNFIPATLVGRNPPRIDCHALVFLPVLEKFPEGTSVTAGIRPEDVSISAKWTEGSREVTVTLTEPAGPFDWVDLVWSGTAVKGIAKLNEGLRPGGRAYMKLPAEKMAFFDASSGARLT
jgi:ABC-type sugar transport system ATPase subunit